MSVELLTLDNLLLSRLTRRTVEQVSAINCTAPTEGSIEFFIRASLSENTQTAYLSDMRQFELWGGTVPAEPDTVARYIACLAGSLTFATIHRRLASISKAHRSRGYSSPTSSELVKSTMRGIRKVNGIAQRETKPLLKDDLVLVLDALGPSLKNQRDRAILLLGFAGAFRRSEIVALNVADIDNVPQGIIVHLRRSKTDQNGKGRKVGIPYGKSRACPVIALSHWLRRSQIEEGPIFRPINRHGQLASARLSGDAVCSIIKESLSNAGMDNEGFSGHSLRAGLATSAAQADVPSWKIRQQTGHASDAMLGRYIRDAKLFDRNAAGQLL